MQALFFFAISKEGPVAKQLHKSFTIPIRNHAQNKYGICETCVILNSEYNMGLHVKAKKHITTLKGVARTMRASGGWLEKQMSVRDNDFWNVQVKPPVAASNPVVITAATSPVEYDAKTGSSTADLFDLKDPQIGFLHSILTGVVSISSYKKMKATQTVPQHIEDNAKKEQRAMIVKMCTTTGHLVISIARRVIEREVRAKILEYYPEVTPQLIDIIAGLQPDILKLIASTPILDSPPPM
ncbi:hypothetical protein EB796_017824 [Bugula neritina]|uniref:Uncharacterized protein n=1 Tax=Bugula neritina TaxID=10212 RepID=A0A7J7JC69_BUGNE|nr:hypothetical protein EB796_017824 [Bugula neritina]